MSKPLEPPGYQSVAQHSLSYSLGSTFFVILGLVNALLCGTALDKALKITPITPALKAGMGFFGCMTAASKRLTDDLIVGERIVATRLHRDILGISTLHTVYSLPVWLMRRLNATAALA